MPEASTADRAEAHVNTLDVPDRLQTFLALDFGSRRTGVAFGTRLLSTARPLATIHAASAATRLLQVQSRVQEWQPDALVVGIPFHPDGAEHQNTLAARKFARSLRGRFKLPLFEVDERYSTTEALSHGARDADAGAACIILEQFLRAIA
ncbi:MAG: Holliday junction resolvase RuvX [Burkholderiaceae bacterium]